MKRDPNHAGTSSASTILEKHPCAHFGGGILDFVYSHMGGKCRVDAARLLDTSMLPKAGHVTELLHNPLLRAPAIRVVTRGESQPVGKFSMRMDYNSRAVDDSLDSPALRRAFAGGSTVIIEDVGKWHPPVAGICNTVFNDQWLYANAAYFITRSGNRGLPFHADE